MIHLATALCPEHPCRVHGSSLLDMHVLQSGVFVVGQANMCVHKSNQGEAVGAQPGTGPYLKLAALGAQSPPKPDPTRASGTPALPSIV